MPPAPEVINVTDEVHAETDLTPKGMTPAQRAALPPSPDGGDGLRRAMNLSPEAQKLMDARKASPGATPGATPAAKPGDAPPPPAPGEYKPKFLHEPDPAVNPPSPAATPKPGAPAPDPIASKDPKDVEAFRTMRQEIETLRKELATRPANADLLKQVQDRDAIIERLSLVESPRFKAQFETPIQQAEGEVKELAKQWGIDDETMQAAMQAATLKDRAEALAGAEPEAKSMLLSALRNLDGSKQKRDAALQNWKGTREQVEQQQEAQLLQHREQISNHVISALRESGVALLMPVEGDEKRSAQAADLEARIRQAIGSKNPVEQGARIAYGVLYDVAQDAYLYERSQRIKLQNELAARRGIQPRPNGGGDAPQAPTTVNRTQPMTADQMAAALAAKHANA